MFKNKEFRNAIYLGLICMVSYLAVYFARNILGVISPQMVESAGFTVEYIGLLSTSSMLSYGMGQLINGRIGDILKAKYMVSTGLFLSGICNLIIPFSASKTIIIIAYGMSGFFLSMIYAPITRAVAENVRPIYASRCSLGYTFASFIAVPAAGMAAALFNWDIVFIICSAILIIMSIVSFIIFTIFEKQGILKYRNTKAVNKNAKGGVKLLIENSIIKFTFVAVLTGIVRTSVVFWIPTYLSQYLGLSAGAAAKTFVAITLVQSFSPYINNLFLYEFVFKRNMNKMLRTAFILGTVGFLMMFTIKIPIINVVFCAMALMGSGGAATMLYSVYCPSLRNTGMVSTATGFLDFMSYVGAALANLLFANAITQIGWGNLILVWTGLMLLGVIVSLSNKRPAQTTTEGI